MDDLEILLLLCFSFLTVLFLIHWYRPITMAWTGGRHRPTKIALSCLPLLSCTIILFTLRTLASFDVKGIFIVFYLLFGFAWLYGGLWFITCFFDLSWRDDALLAGNKAALYTVAGAFLGLTCIYAGANVGDGPGWWCVLFAGGLGFAAWVALAFLFNLCVGIFERVTVDRDIGCGIRFGCYLLASGILLGRASAGDWTSFSATIVEFCDGWPVLPLTLFALAVEWFFLYRAKHREENLRPHAPDHRRGLDLSVSIVWGTALVAATVAAVLLLPPPKENPIYRMSQEYNATMFITALIYQST